MKLGWRLAVGGSIVACLGGTVTACLSSGDNPPPQPSGDAGTFDAGGTRFDAGIPVDTGLPVDTGSPIDAGRDTSSPDTSVEDAGTDAIANDTGGPDAPVDTGADAAPPVTTLHVDPVNGLDANDGSKATPFRTIARAATAINASDAGAGPFQVSLADGQYDKTSQATLQVNFNYPTFVHASAPGKATILGQGPAAAQEILIFHQGGGVINVTFKDTWYGVEAIHGSFNVVGCSFDGAGQGGYFAAFINEVVGIFDTTGAVTLTNLKQGSLGQIYVDNTAKVTWLGGGTTTINGGGGAGYNLVFLRGGGQLSIDRVAVTNWLGYVGVAYDQAKISLTTSQITGSGWAAGVGGITTGGAFYLGGSQTGAPSPTLTLNDTSITSSQGSAVAIGLTSTTAAVAVSLTGSHLDGSTLAGIWVNGATNAALVVNVTAAGSTIDNNGLAAIYTPRATVSFSGTGNSISGNGAQAAAHGQTAGGIVITDAASVNGVTLRGTAVKNNTGNQIALAGTAASVLDLGTAASAGGVTFAGVAAGAGASAVSLTAPIAGTALGDTWMPGVQGADGTGKYAAQTTITGPASGLNVTVPTGASVVVGP